MTLKRFRVPGICIVASLLLGAFAYVSRSAPHMMTSCAQQIDDKGNLVGPSCAEMPSARFYIAGLGSVALIFSAVVLIAKDRKP